VVADASNLNRNLFLFSQIYDTRIPCLLCLNMIDIAEQKSMVFDIKGLSAKLGDLPIFKINARKKDGVPQLLDYITVYATSHTH
jgi:ferrous iron transport protein B